MYNSDSHAAEGKAMYPCPPEEATPIAYGLNVYGGNRIWSIGAKTEYPELCMAILNWLSTPEGRMTSEYGPKDVCWYYDENGIYTGEKRKRRYSCRLFRTASPTAVGKHDDISTYQHANIPIYQHTNMQTYHYGDIYCRFYFSFQRKAEQSFPFTKAKQARGFMSA